MHPIETIKAGIANSILLATNQKQAIDNVTVVTLTAQKDFLEVILEVYKKADFETRIKMIITEFEIEIAKLMP